ncbi:hypothetical protein LSM04_003985 [Trypanosoma melophagium]|uniref:uncharacterized protein n=1 Tax=Trypanosoma melophagium TaxID=715481 RepID=UPI00351A5697|nr:hypothetical protein LSM04_003985 [Trypanosoma melophagium]
MGAFARADVGIAAGTACVNAWKENIKSCGDNAALAKTAARDMEEFVERLERGRKTNEENKTEGAEGLKELWAAKKLQELRELVRGANEMITKTDSTVVGLRNSIAVLRVAPADCLTSKEELVSLAREIGGEAERHARDLSLDSENMNKFVLVVFNRTNVLQVRGREIEEQQAKARGVANLADKGARDVEAAIKRARTQVEVANSAIPWGALEEVQEAQKDKEGPKEGFENIAGGTERKSKDGELLVGDAEKKSEILAVPEIVKEVKKTKENQRIADEKKSAEEATAQSRREAGDQQHAAKGKEEQKKAKEEAEQAKEAEKEAKMSEEEVKGITEKVESKAKC